MRASVPKTYKVQSAFLLPRDQVPEMAGSCACIPREHRLHEAAAGRVEPAVPVLEIRFGKACFGSG